MTHALFQDQRSIWKILLLYHELDEAIAHLEEVVTCFDRNRANVYGFKEALAHMRNCSARLEAALETYAPRERAIP